MDSLISQVRDLLPDLGEGFVELCLEYYDLVPERVINALLEGKNQLQLLLCFFFIQYFRLFFTYPPLVAGR